MLQCDGLLRSNLFNVCQSISIVPVVHALDLSFSFTGLLVHFIEVVFHASHDGKTQEIKPQREVNAGLNIMVVSVTCYINLGASAGNLPGRVGLQKS